MSLLTKIRARGKKLPARIVFPEPHDKRVQEAALKLKSSKVTPILLGKKFTQPSAKDLERYAKRMYTLRKHKGWTLEKCKKLLKDPNYVGVMMVVCNDADAMIAGSSQPTANTLRPALQLLKKDRFVSGAMLLLTKERELLFADVAVTPNPDAKTLATFAKQSANTMQALGKKPKVALLSFSTKGSAQHELVTKVQKATKLLKNAPFVVDGELQADAAIVSEVAKKKAPKSKIKGNANVLIFPDLQSGNIGYKLAQRFGNAKGIGPIIQGLKKPVHDLSRGCTTQTIVDLAYLTALQVNK